MAENATVGMDEMAENATTLGHECLFWDISFGALFYTGNVLVGIGFVIPQSYAYSLISFRATMVVGGDYVLLIVNGVPYMLSLSIN